MKSICLTLLVALLPAVNTVAQPLPPLVRQAAMGATIIASDDTAADSAARNTAAWAKDKGAGGFDLKR